ncbi:MAG: hypothetical protein R3A13_00980 [Bdellovibrionota bacterium]
MRITKNTYQIRTKAPRRAQPKQKNRKISKSRQNNPAKNSSRALKSLVKETPVPTEITGLRDSIGLVLQVKDGKLGEDIQEVSDLKRVNETEMYAAYVHNKLSSSNPELAKQFMTKLQEQTLSYKENRGEHLFYKASDQVMRTFVREKQLKKKEYKTIKYEAFGKSQFDSDRTQISAAKLETLKDGDTAVRAVKTALAKANENKSASDPEFQVWRAHEASISRQKWKEKKRAGLLGTRGANHVDATGKTQGIPDGFLWKPESDSDGRLVVLLPKNWTGKAAEVKILSPDGKKLIETGRYTSIANGFRQHYRFNKSGGGYPNNATVQVTFTDGSITNIKIGSSGNRNE